MKTNPFPLHFSGHLLWLSTAVVALILLLLGIWILVLLRFNKQKELRRREIRAEWNSILAGLLMNETPTAEVLELPPAFAAQLKKPFVRAVLASELVRTSQSLRGQMAETVTAVYNQLGLAGHSGKLFYSSKWHRMAKGIQQVSAMAQHRFFKPIYRRTNNPNPWVRNEAQLGMIRLHSVQGLRFLKYLRQPLSEWQQFNLLHQLQLQNTKELPDAAQWLQSENHSVILFTIRLCQVFQCFQYAEQITALQQHPDPSIGREANLCLHRWGLADLNTEKPLTKQPAPEILFA